MKLEEMRENASVFMDRQGSIESSDTGDMDELRMVVILGNLWTMTAEICMRLEMLEPTEVRNVK